MSAHKMFIMKSVRRPILHLGFRNASTKKRSFDEAIATLNSLQGNAAAINKSIQVRQQQKHDDGNFNLRDTAKFLERIDGFTLKSLEKLSFIHVAGSKGKGSVCTYTDSMLREFDVKTGLFTSPHLISVTERIKLMGSSISKHLFTKYFWEVYDSLEKRKENENDLPSYFKFLQIMALYIFVKENIDVAIIEVGIGGQYDSTNIIRNTEIVGITVLQLEHTNLLGNTLEEIAWQKSGIIKENSYVYTMNQPSECIRVINDRFIELKGKRLSTVPAFETYTWLSSVPDFTHTSDINRFNFSLASQLSGRWLRNRNKLPKSAFIGDLMVEVDKKFVDAFRKCHFDGRFQRVDGDNVTYFLDGAHTKDSMEICARWFTQQITDSNALKILVFNVTGDRDSELILKQLHSINFDYVCFSTNITSDDTCNDKNENFSGVLQSVQLERCMKHKEIWAKFPNSNKSEIIISPTIQDALDIIHDIKDNNSLQLSVLFTGSLHLVGGSLKMIKMVVDQKRSQQAKRKRLRK